MPNIDLRAILIAGFLAGCAAAGVGVGAVVWLGPHVWAWIKPILHAATA